MRHAHTLKLSTVVALPAAGAMRPRQRQPPLEDQALHLRSEAGLRWLQVFLRRLRVIVRVAAFLPLQICRKDRTQHAATAAAGGAVLPSAPAWWHLCWFLCPLLAVSRWCASCSLQAAAAAAGAVAVLCTVLIQTA
jgi:hypothetical protein